MIRKDLMTHKKLGKAIEFAFIKHKDQVDKQGKPYILHCVRILSVLSNMLGKLHNEFDFEKALDIQIVGVLHDIIEDTNIKEQEIRDLFGDRVANAIVAISRCDKEPYETYLQRVAENEIALIVKLVDIEDNLLPWRLDKLSEDKRNYFIKKYAEAKKILNFRKSVQNISAVEIDASDITANYHCSEKN